MSASEKLLDALRALSIEAHGPRIDVSFESLSLVINVPIANTGITNVADSVTRFFSSAFSTTKKRRLQVLDGVSGCLRAGTTTLVLGNGGGGKTSLLRRLSARDTPGGTAPGEFGGRVLWNGETPDPIRARKLAAFAPQFDIHEPLLTVRETLTFAAASCLAPLRADASDAERTLRRDLVDLVIDMLDLRECEGVVVGDEMRRGISGGQKKRVTIGETLLQGARVLVLDEATNGLDSATAMKIMRFIADWARVTGGTVIAALQAPTPEVLSVFSNVLVLSDGYCLYSGTPAGLEPYFAAKGYSCPDYMDIADYTLALAVSPAYVQESFPTADVGAPSVTAFTRESLAAEWRMKVKTEAERAATMGGVVLTSKQHLAQFANGTAHSSLFHMKLLVSRQGKIVSRNPAVSFGRVFQFVVLGALYGSVYYQIKLDDFVTKISAAMFAASTVSFASFAEIPAIFVNQCEMQAPGTYNLRLSEALTPPPPPPPGRQEK